MGSLSSKFADSLLILAQFQKRSRYFLHPPLIIILLHQPQQTSAVFRHPDPCQVSITDRLRSDKQNMITHETREDLFSPEREFFLNVVPPDRDCLHAFCTTNCSSLSLLLCFFTLSDFLLDRRVIMNPGTMVYNSIKFNLG